MKWMWLCVVCLFCLAGCQTKEEVSSTPLSSLSSSSASSAEEITASQTTAEDITTPSTRAPVKTLPKVTTTTTQKPTTTTAATVRVTVIEGETLAQIAVKMEKNGVCNASKLIATANSYDFSYYPLIAAQPTNANRCFKLEGYLFPDTYTFYKNELPQDVLGKFLRNAENKISADLRAEAASTGYTIEKILTLASLIQKEGSKASEMAKVSAIIHNRLKKSQRLELDASIVYVEKSIKPYITGDKNRFNSAYNTYKCAGLPAGAIGNPGLSAIKAALHPADVPYLYFCNDKQGHYYYAETYEQHQENLKQAGLTAE